MGGGDLNSKKSWHPNTMKNQERVWKAEQAAAEEKKRIQELQHERAAERDRAELNDLAKRSAGDTGDDNRLHWMYDKPDKKAHHEDYLLGKAIEKNYDQPEKTDDIIPAVARRVVGSSTVTSMGDTQVDLARKMREDPLLLVKERERAARAALLNNPVHRKRLTQLLRKEQEQRKCKEKKSKKKGKDLDNMLAAKLNALGGDKGLDITSLLASDDSSSSSDYSEDEKPKKKKKKGKKSKKSSKKISKMSDDSSSDDKKRTKNKNKDSEYKQSSGPDSEEDKKSKLKSSYSQHKKSSIKDVSERKSRKARSESCDSNTAGRSKRTSSYHNRRQIGHSPKTRRSHSVDSTCDERQRGGFRKDMKYNSNIKVSRRNEYDRNWDTRRNTRKRSSSHDSDREIKYKKSKRDEDEKKKKNASSRKYSESEGSDGEGKYKRHQKYFADNRQARHSRENTGTPSPEIRSQRDSKTKNTVSGKGRDSGKANTKKGGLSEEERAARLAEMAAAGAEREQSRGRRVAEQLARARAADTAPRPARAVPHRALPDSLETRIHSNRHYIQRGKHHMNEHFARR